MENNELLKYHLKNISLILLEKRRRDETLKFAEVFNMDDAEIAKQKRRQAEWLKKTSAKPNQGLITHMLHYILVEPII